MRPRNTTRNLVIAGILLNALLAAHVVNAGEAKVDIRIHSPRIRLPLPPLPLLPPLPPLPPLPVIIIPSGGHDRHSERDRHCEDVSRHRGPQTRFPGRESLEEQAWRHWRMRQYEAAYRDFGRLLRHRPHNAWIQVAYAVAAYHCGQNHDVLEALRRAVLIDLTGLRRGPQIPAMRIRLQELRTAYLPGRRMHHCHRPAGAGFIVAVTSYALGDTRLAEHFIRRAMRGGDHHRSTRILAHVLRVDS